MSYPWAKVLSGHITPPFHSPQSGPYEGSMVVTGSRPATNIANEKNVIDPRADIVVSDVWDTIVHDVRLYFIFED